jgi:hypothetical protein
MVPPFSFRNSAFYSIDSHYKTKAKETPNDGFGENKPNSGKNNASPVEIDRLLAFSSHYLVRKTKMNAIAWIISG